MSTFAYSDAPVPIRGDIPAAHRGAWERLAAPGSWWTGAERVAIAAEVRNAAKCALCSERKAALSPEAVQGAHDRVSELPDPALDVVHRVTTDPGRLTRTWFERTLAAGLSDAQYVEIVGVVVAVVSIDSFHRGLGMAPEPLPEPEPGEPSRYRPASARSDGAWVPMIDKTSGDEADLWRGRTANVIRAMSLVPDAVRQLKELSQAHYLPLEMVVDASASRGSLTRPQMELIAGRVSALNECFYWTTAHAMLLRASSGLTGDEADVHAVTDPDAAEDSGVPHAAALVAFAEAVVRGDDQDLARTRARVLESLGPEALVDAAAVAGNFQRMDRIADSTGIPLDGPMGLMTGDLRTELGIDAFGSSANTPASSALARSFGRLLQPVAMRIFRFVSRRYARS